ncbi:MAG: sigma-70 family RNA polymerase sigma factor [Anaerovibrio sp.]
MQLDKYLAELNKIELLEYHEEQALWHAYKECGSQKARKRLIESYQPLVFKLAAPFRGLDNLMDVLQEGTVGLIEAIEGFDYSRGVAFSLFASYRIKGRMYNFLKKEGRADVACLEGGSEQLSPLELLADTGVAVAEQVELQEASSQLQSAMSRLPEREQMVLEQIYVRCHEVSEVAEQMNLSTSYIYRLQKSGVRRVRGMLSRFMHNWK